ncbi:hypothetical protein H5410_029512 [Solanum commersonii]|uniref:NB-ARC domain-containing protein n=1 Tax=Solanum commersonii TaxID=4109 RepID=A0A9J5Z982_SOLCO|nr:hypothetical protein H5410_029512 [Solanum commersonii]
MEIGKENEGEMEKLASNSLVSSAVLREDIVDLMVSLEVMHICCTNLKGSKSEEVGLVIKQLLQASADILRESLIHLQEHMVINAVTPNIHVMIEFLLIILTDVPKEVIRHDKLFVLLARVRELRIRSCCNLEDMNEAKIKQVKEDLEIIRSFLYVEQELHRDLWTRVLDVAYEAEHAIHSILAEIGLLQLIFILPDTVEKIKLVKKRYKRRCSIIVANAPNKLVERNSSSTVGKIIVGFEEETQWIIRKLTSGPAEIDVISIVGMPGIGKTTLAFRVYNDKSIVDQTFVLGAQSTRNQSDFNKSEKEVALHGKCHSDPLYLRLLRSEESWELLEKRVFGEERCPDELKDVGEKIARKCGGLPLVLDLIGGVISRKEKKEALWLEVLNNLSSFIFKDEEEVVKVIQLSYDHLSDHVKPCLVYLAIYPKDKDIRISKLKDLWNAQGFEIKVQKK